MRIVLSSEHDANMRSLTGFHATELTEPSPWPTRTSSRAPVSRCQMYTFPSVAQPKHRRVGDRLFCVLRVRARSSGGVYGRAVGNDDGGQKDGRRLAAAARCGINGEMRWGMSVTISHSFTVEMTEEQYLRFH